MCFMSVGVRAFDDIPVGARPAGLGEAFTAVADDVHSLYYNPAGLASLYRPEVTAYYARLFPNLSDQTRTAFTFVGGALPLPKDGRWGTLGLGYQEFKVDSLFKEQTVTLGYGRSLWSDRMALGMGLKQLDRSYGTNAFTLNAFQGTNPGDRTGAGDPVFKNGNSKSALGLDLGSLYALTPRVRLGLSFANINRPDMGLIDNDRLPLVTRLGVAYDKIYTKLSAGVSQRTFLTKKTDTRLHLGGERQWSFRRFGLLSVRGGAAVGSRDYRQVNLGAGYEVNGLGVDYVFTLPMGAAEETGNMHNVSLSFKFGRSISEDDLADDLLHERQSAARAVAAMEEAEVEAAYIKEERNKLLGEYATKMELLKTALEEARQSQRPTLVVPSRQLTPAEREKSARGRARQEFESAYDASMRAYSTLVSRGATLAERVNLLKGTLSKYENKGINVSQAKRELSRVNAALAQVSTDYRITMDFYRKTVARGANVAERMSLLERVMKKYATSGLDLSDARREIAKLKKMSGEKQP